MAKVMDWSTRRRGAARSGAARRCWRIVLLSIGGLALVGPLALSVVADLPPIVFALPPMVVWVAIWTYFRQLDAPRPPPPPTPPPGSRARVVHLRREQTTRAFDARRRAG